MNTKGQIGLGFIIMAAVTILIGLAFYTGSFAENIGTLTQTRDTANSTITLPADGENLNIENQCGQQAISGVVTNATGGEIVPSTNYTFSQAAGTDGFLSAFITTTTSPYAETSVNISCSYQPRGYIDDGGSRAIVLLIAIFMSLLILTAALPDIRDKAFDWIKG